MDYEDVDRALDLLPDEILYNREFQVMRQNLKFYFNGKPYDVLKISINKDLLKGIPDVDRDLYYESSEDEELISIAIDTNDKTIYFNVIQEDFVIVNMNLIDIATRLTDSVNVYIGEHYDFTEFLGYYISKYSLSVYDKNGIEVVWDWNMLLNANFFCMSPKVCYKVKKNYDAYQKNLLYRFAGPMTFKAIEDGMYADIEDEFLGSSEFIFPNMPILDKLRKIVGSNEIVITLSLYNDIIQYNTNNNLKFTSGFIITKISDGYMQYGVYTDFREIYYTARCLSGEEAVELFSINEMNLQNDSLCEFFDDGRTI